MFRLKDRENYMMIDHRAGPGMPENYSRAFGLPLLPAGKLVEMATLTCGHCTGQVLINPDRTRDRGFCPKCFCYLCDSCVAISREPDYQHRPWKQVVDLVKEGKAILLPGSTHGRPLLLFIKE